MLHALDTPHGIECIVVVVVVVYVSLIYTAIVVLSEKSLL